MQANYLFQLKITSVLFNPSYGTLLYYNSENVTKIRIFYIKLHQMLT